MGRLTVGKVRSLTKAGRYADGETLHLVVKPSGSKSWVQRLTVDGVRRDIGLGSCRFVSLAEARERAFENRRQARRGGDPLADRRRRVLTFEQAARRTFEANRARWRGRTAHDWEQVMGRHILPALGGKPVDRIGREDVLRVLTPIWSSTPAVAKKVRQRIKAVLSWAQAHGHVEVNFAGEAINGALPRQRVVRSHLRALPHQEVPDALIAIGASGEQAVKACIRFVVLTACRSGEARLATWDEVDLQAREWRIPAGRMKTGVEHRVPLSDAALDVLESVRALRGSSGLIFPSPKKPGEPLSDRALARILKVTGLADRATIHGFRSSFRDWCADTGKPREVAEAALAHVVGGVEGAYFRSDLFARRRQLMDAWAAYVTGDSGKVVAFRA